MDMNVTIGCSLSNATYLTQQPVHLSLEATQTRYNIGLLKQ